jgi:hypothetical protein
MWIKIFLYACCGTAMVFSGLDSNWVAFTWQGVCAVSITANWIHERSLQKEIKRLHERRDKGL